ncbi:Abi family protein [Klebsiella pneumoniae]|uniref:Abi family protein n=1 Tax=Klebsiella pneumoniae complex TaxID=3390273 RepID=UPI000E35B923|nr:MULTISPECIES: Abi family protein [Klebsiella]EIY5056913.1 Abi family protein [Klebsiella variicola]AXS11840.1 hypothetical protein D0899_27275 [Klebsiella pneumoniae]MCE0053771.1 Abi family protein [Klebsiella quasipneumoniae subsp. quasipneumoniae]MCQ0577590.1 Abi family protein [Klebsiella pneumoniae]TYW59111.1 Abi family protein [Klebsiella pneumoniae]
MLHNEPSNIASCIIDTSAVRLSSYRIFFRVDDESAFAIYKWNEEVSSRLMKLVGVIEVTLRNRIHSAMSQAVQTLARGNLQNNDWFNHLSLGGGTQSKLNKVLLTKGNRPKNPQPSPNFVVSKMTYGFWPNILKTDKKTDNKRLEWETLFPLIFPGLPPATAGYWKTLKHRESVIARCFSVGELRNRIAHFEPVWKFGSEIEESIPKHNYVPKVVNPAPQNKHEAVARLNMEFSRAMQLLNWLSPHAYQDYLKSESKRSLDWLITESAIDAFIKHKEIGKISFNKTLKARHIKRLSSKIKGCSLITMKKEPIGMIFLYP